MVMQLKNASPFALIPIQQSLINYKKIKTPVAFSSACDRRGTHRDVSFRNFKYFQMILSTLNRPSPSIRYRTDQMLSDVRHILGQRECFNFCTSLRSPSDTLCHVNTCVLDSVSCPNYSCNLPKISQFARVLIFPIRLCRNHI